MGILLFLRSLAKSYQRIVDQGMEFVSGIPGARTCLWSSVPQEWIPLSRLLIIKELAYNIPAPFR